MKPKMNLTTDPWIPVVWKNGQPGLVSLCEAFENGDQIQDLSVRPNERIALMRLLLCITQAALDGPANKDDWRTCKERIKVKTLDYLKKWHSAFELFGDGPRFLQVGGLKAKPKNNKTAKPDDECEDEEGVGDVSKLDLSLATGNNTRLFDNAGGSGRSFSPAQLALMLLSFQCFSPGGRIGILLWQGIDTPGDGTSGHAPCLPSSMLHTFVRGLDLMDTIFLNLITKDTVKIILGMEKWGSPIWENMPVNGTSSDAIRNATETYLGRLVPLSRTIYLADDYASFMLANGLKYDPGIRELSATIIMKSDGSDRIIKGISLDKSLWRELHSLFVIKVASNSIGGPLALANLDGNQAVDLWTGGLAADKAKLLDVVESIFHVPHQMFQDAGQQIYQNGVGFSESISKKMGDAVGFYCEQIKDGSDRKKAAHARYWTAIEGEVPKLLSLLENPAPLGAEGHYYQTAWGKAVLRSARIAYDHACPRGTPRQIQAHALGLKVLFRNQKPSKTKTEAAV